MQPAAAVLRTSGVGTRHVSCNATRCGAHQQKRLVMRQGALVGADGDCRSGGCLRMTPNEQRAAAAARHVGWHQGCATHHGIVCGAHLQLHARRRRRRLRGRRRCIHWSGEWCSSDTSTEARVQRLGRQRRCCLLGVGTSLGVASGFGRLTKKLAACRKGQRATRLSKVASLPTKLGFPKAKGAPPTRSQFSKAIPCERAPWVPGRAPWTCACTSGSRGSAGRAEPRPLDGVSADDRANPVRPCWQPKA